MEEKRKIKIKVEDLTLIFGKRKQEALALLEKGISKEEILKKTKCTVGVNKVSFEIKEGEIFVIMGLSGSGKSTLIRCLNRLNEPTSGKVFFDDHDITRETNKELLETRRTQMSMVFQKFGLLPHRTILENAAFGLEIRGDEKQEREEKALQALETVGLKGYEYQYPSEMSGGMQQRVGLARALANDPEVLLMDEAFSALDPLIKSDMQDELLAIQNKLQKTIVFITHDLDEAMKIGDRIAIMKDGVVEQIGTAEDILTGPATEYVEAFVNKVDRKTIITAESLMFKKITLVQIAKDGPKGSIRKMRDIGVDILPVEDEKRRFLGYVWLRDLLELEKEKEMSIEKALKKNVPSVYKSYSVEDMLPLIIGTKYPLAVIEEDTGKLLGLISQTSLIIEATRFEKEEISELKERANEM
ncbi:glycine betaine/L-proline ABC transporter ATP-binding protein [Flavobacterium frigoris]|uniref:Glycine betaine ABC transport system, ATP-binding protein OpuAA n=1 Tax=Flavobacterium frigoris (strain PS1) TaxID=1086011 RepID=H7FU44_FLAFP|nr:glycine betaine/L-proline ABC transporter ATP-binding protein [Flavobacterium frigoris]EIA07896.1 glycine betaine ABC transport system, ATP-binding protein OpuAA [Flavobacterium frigoris PS1]